MPKMIVSIARNTTKDKVKVEWVRGFPPIHKTSTVLDPGMEITIFRKKGTKLRVTKI